MSEREQVRVEVFTLDRWSVPDTLRQLQIAVAKALDAVPPELRDTIALEHERDYDGGDGSWSAAFWRDETDEEMAERLETEARYARESEAREIAEFNRLRAKFGAA